MGPPAGIPQPSTWKHPAHWISGLFRETRPTVPPAPRGERSEPPSSPTLATASGALLSPWQPKRQRVGMVPEGRGNAIIFASASPLKRASLNNSLTHYTKGTRPDPKAGQLPPVTPRSFSVFFNPEPGTFHLSLTVLPRALSVFAVPRRESSCIRPAALLTLAAAGDPAQRRLRGVTCTASSKACLWLG